MSNVNRQLAALFEQMAAAGEILGADRFRVNAFQRAARVIGELGDDIEAIGPDEKALTALDGIGKGTAERIIEFLETGKIEDHQELIAQLPDGLLNLLDIPGLGPKTVGLLWHEGGVTDMASLKSKLEGDELAKLPGLGKKKLENLRKGIAFAESSGGRVRLGQALPLALWIVQQIRSLESAKEVAYAGSLRRGRETIGDIDIIVAADSSGRKKIADKFLGLEIVSEVLVQGETKCSVRMQPEDRGPAIQVDLRMVEPDQYGAALLYFTGSKEHNVTLRQRAIKQGYSLNEYALTSNDGRKQVAAETEKAIYDKLGLKWIAPELREDRGEIDRAASDDLPALITLDDIKAELHTHTTASDGVWSIEELAVAAADRGFHTVAVTDHSKGQAQANGLSNKRLEQHIEDVRAVAKKLKDRIIVLAGSEVDILADGKLDYPDSLLRELDIVVASPHAALSQDSKKATQRLLRAIENRYITILGHPTGRLINRREGLSPDMKQLAQAARKRGIAMEINANNWRLDLRDTHARLALEHGVKLSINTDAHGESDLDQLYYGILTARRAGATRENVINCMSKTALAKWIKATRR